MQSRLRRLDLRSGNTCESSLWVVYLNKRPLPTGSSLDGTRLLLFVNSNNDGEVGWPEGIDDDEARAEWLLDQWAEGSGRSKSALEVDVWNDSGAHGRHFDRFVQGITGKSTTRPSKQSNRIQELETQIRSLGFQPRGAIEEAWEEPLRHARSACLEALKVWNDPTSAFRTGAFALLFVTSWNALCISLLETRSECWWEDGPERERALATIELVDRAFPGDENRGLRMGVQFWVDIRNAVAHRVLPALDSAVIPWAQGGLLAIEGVFEHEFGADHSIAQSLSVPLQLSGFRDPGVLGSLKKLQSSLPLDIQAVLSNAATAPDEVLSDPRYMLRVAFIPVVPSSQRKPDAVAYFVPHDQVPSELSDEIDRYLVLKKTVLGSRPDLTATEVIKEVQRRIGFRFDANRHIAAARALKVRPRMGATEKTIKVEFAEFNTAFKRWAYSQAWIDYLVDELSDPKRFEQVTGKQAIETE